MAFSSFTSMTVRGGKLAPTPNQTLRPDRKTAAQRKGK